MNFALCLCILAVPALAQNLATTAKAAAPVDLTGYWVSVVTEDYRWRMFTPLKGDAASVPINDAGRKIIDAWDPAKDEAAGLECKAYGAAAVMRVPGRLRRHVYFTSAVRQPKAWSPRGKDIPRLVGTQVSLPRPADSPALDQVRVRGTAHARWRSRRQTFVPAISGRTAYPTVRARR